MKKRLRKEEKGQHARDKDLEHEAARAGVDIGIGRLRHHPPHKYHRKKGYGYYIPLFHDLWE